MERKLAGAFASGEDEGELKKNASLAPSEAEALRRALAARDAEALGEAWASAR